MLESQIPFKFKHLILFLYRFDENFAFDRTESRLIEMEGHRYRERATKRKEYNI